MNKKNIKDNQAHDIVLEFYGALGKGDIKKGLSLVSDDIEYIAVKGTSNTYPELYGIYKGKEELIHFFNHLSDFYITEDFRVDSFASNGDEAFMKGYLKYKIKKNNKLYDTHWMANVKLKDGKIFKYRFFKDTAFLEEQYSK